MSTIKTILWITLFVLALIHGGAALVIFLMVWAFWMAGLEPEE